MAITTAGYVGGKPEISWWISQIRKGIAFRKKFAHEERWDQWRSYYRGNWPRGTLPVNVFFRMARTIVPRTYFRNPSISVIATKPGAEQQVFSQLIERLDNKMIRTMGVKGQIKKMVQNAFFFGTAAGKLGFGAEFTPTPDISDTSAPEHTTGSMKRRVEYNSLVQPNMPWFMSVHPGNLIVPDGLMNYEDTPWVATWLKRSIDDVQSDDRLSHVADLKPNTGRGTPERPVGLKHDRADMIDLVEIRDMRTEKAIIIAPYSSNRILYFDDDGMQINNRSNIYPVIFNDDDEVFWGVPDSAILEPQQLELNETRTLQMQHRRLSLVKLLYEAGAIDKTMVDKLLDGTVLGAIQVNDLSKIDTREIGHIPESLFAADSVIQGDIRDTMGFSRNQAGEYASQKSHNAPTAQEARNVQMASDIRVDERRDIIADVLVNVFEDANVLMFEKFNEDQIVQVVGPEGVPYWVAFTPSMLKAARYEMNIDPDSAVPETKDVRTDKALATYERLKTNPLIDPQLLTKYLLHELHGVQFDSLMRTVQQNASSGAAGGTPETPMDVAQYMQMMAQGG